MSTNPPLSVEDRWRGYADCWSLDEGARAAELARCLVSGVSYCDPLSVVKGTQSLSTYMADFQRDIPNGRFEIVGVLHHHDRSLASWRLLGGDGDILQTGTSSAVHAHDGRLETITGFFDTPTETGSDKT